MTNDLTLYNRCAHDWWNPSSRFSATLHALNRVRLDELRQRIGLHFTGTIVDLGCGGGLLSEPLALAGATVIGVDISTDSIAEATRHGNQQQAQQLTYLQMDARNTSLPDGCADLVICADVVEHCADWPRIIGEAARIARPGALLYVHTINRTWRARLVAVWIGEGLGLVPRGTHDHQLFVTPTELKQAAATTGWICDGVMGQRVRCGASLTAQSLVFGPGSGTWCTYSAWFQRLAP